MKLKLLLLTIPNIAAKTKVLRAPRTFLLRYMNFAIKHLSLTISKAIGDFFASAGNCRSVSTTLAGTTNRFLNKRVNSLFCACAPIVNIQWTVWQRGQISQETESMTFAVVLPEQLLENNKEKKSSYFFRCEKEGGHLFKELRQEALQIDYPYKFLRTNLLTLEKKIPMRIFGSLFCPSS